MTRRLLAVLLAGTLAAVPTTLRAQLNSSFGIAAGLAAPVSDLGNVADAGYNLAAHLNLGAPLIPIGVRLEGAYNSFNGKSSLASTSQVHILSGTVNAQVALGPSGASPYVIGGVGLYKRSFTNTTTSNGDRTAGGFNLGAGLRFPLGVMSTFVEARYHKILGDVDTQFVPITFGINF